MVPGWDVFVAEELKLPRELVRLPITQAGCAGGLLSIAQAAEYVRAHPTRSAAAVAVELCSLAFHADPEPGNLVSALLFGDGAGAALLEPSENGLRVLEHRCMLVPNSDAALGFDLTDQGFYPRLSLDLADILVEPFLEAVGLLLEESELSLRDLSYFLIHPGGPRILQRVQVALDIRDEQLRWSYESLRNVGNMSSAAIFDVIERFMNDPEAPSGYGLLVAFGPGVSIELLLVQRC
jgi:alkylresorcinol/alkylpyrone synthase